MYKNEVFLILSIIDNKNMEDLANIYDIKPTKIWNKGDFRVKGSILKHKDFGFTIEKKYKNICHVKTILSKFLKDKNVKKTIALQNVKKILSVVIYANCTDEYTGSLPSLCYDTQILEILAKNEVNLEHDIYLV